MPVADQEVKPENRIDADHRYGCNGKPRPTPENFYFAPNGTRQKWGSPNVAEHGLKRIYYTGSTECRYDMSETDTRCAGCEHRIQPPTQPVVADLTPEGWSMEPAPGANAMRSFGDPERSGMRWNEQERADMLAAWNNGNGLSMVLIAKKHRRRESGIHAQLYALGALDPQK